eukprot:jgi/Psemu1/201609/e_gw1.282.52.1
MQVITIDGSKGEGGGQILRNACAYAAILRNNVKIVNIRAGRKTPGLRPQHLVGLRLLATTSGASLAKGDSVGSTEILFLADKGSPKHNNNEYVGDTQTAGSICLLLQTVLPFALVHEHRESSLLRFLLKGGTDTDFAPPFDYFRHVFLPVLKNYSVTKDDSRIQNSALDVSLVRRGFFPRGGGEVRAAIRRPCPDTFPLRPIRLTERGEIAEITIRSFSAGNCPRSMAKQLSAIVEGTVVASNPSHRHIPVRVVDTVRRRLISSGCGVLVVAKTDTGCLLGGSSIGSPKIPLEETARVAARQVIEAMEGGGCVDDYLQDQLILYMALAEGVSEVVTNSLTLHTRTAIWVASQMLPSVRFQVAKLGRTEEQEQIIYDETDLLSDATARNEDISGRIPGLHRIRCHGIGFRPEDKP